MLGKKNDITEDKKTVELFLLIAEKLKSKPNYGATLHNKALFFVDYFSYLDTGKKISKFKYVKQDYGPTPKPNQILPLRENLISNGDLEMDKKPFWGQLQQRYVPKRDVDDTIFTEGELDLIDEVINGISDLNGTEISDMSHQLLCWKIPKYKEEIPEHTFLLSEREPTEKEINWGLKMARTHELGNS